MKHPSSNPHFKQVLLVEARINKDWHNWTTSVSRKLTSQQLVKYKLKELLMLYSLRLIKKEKNV